MNDLGFEDRPATGEEFALAWAFVERTCPDDAPSMLEALGLVSYRGKARHRTLSRPVEVERYGWTS